tara:strand:- start:1092 stop:1952 length:861 start_codon:yes stop_codon:yes gene_type:complete
MLEVKDLVMRFYTYDGVVNALNGVSFKVDKGEIFGLVGETGCGKSVTCYSILHLLPSTAKVEEGSVLLEDEDLLKAPEKRLREIRGGEIAMIFQDPLSALNPVMRVGKQIAEVIILHQQDEIKTVMKSQDISEKEASLFISVESLRQVKMPDPEQVINSYPHELSGGMQQRAMIAMALAGKPKLLIADEPTTALDVTIQAQILQLIRDINADLDMSVLLITHDLGVVSEMCKRVAVMYNGNIVEQGNVSDILTKPKDPYTQGLIAALPSENKGRLKVPDVTKGDVA